MVNFYKGQLWRSYFSYKEGLGHYLIAFIFNGVTHRKIDFFVNALLSVEHLGSNKPKLQQLKPKVYEEIYLPSRSGAGGESSTLTSYST